MIGAAALWLLVARDAWRPTPKRDPRPARAAILAALLDLAVLAEGLAYWLSARDVSANAARILDFNLFGSILPAAGPRSGLDATCG